MKTIKQILLIVLLCVSYNNLIAQNMYLLPIAQRDSLLISISKEAILKYGPDYYREYKQPEIRYKIVPNTGDDSKGKNANRIFYIVTYQYDPIEETLEWDFAAEVRIWAETGDLFGVTFGTGFGRSIPEGMDWRNDTTIEPIPYQESIVPIYDINPVKIPDSIVGEEAREEYFNRAMSVKFSNPEPVNKDKLISKGFVKNSDGQWVRTRPDTPPAAAQKVIQREIAKMKEMNSR